MVLVNVIVQVTQQLGDDAAMRMGNRDQESCRLVGVWVIFAIGVLRGLSLNSKGIVDLLHHFKMTFLPYVKPVQPRSKRQRIDQC